MHECLESRALIYIHLRITIMIFIGRTFILRSVYKRITFALFLSFASNVLGVFVIGLFTIRQFDNNRKCARFCFIRKAASPNL